MGQAARVYMDLMNSYGKNYSSSERAITSVLLIVVIYIIFEKKVIESEMYHKGCVAKDVLLSTEQGVETCMQ
jgi:hypothetical protein